jgi:hypothetical protein
MMKLVIVLFGLAIKQEKENEWRSEQPWKKRHLIGLVWSCRSD